MKRLLVPVLPAALSLALSLCTVGSTVGWQDSGYMLAAVRELGVLYPPGFVLYLISCKAWTLVLGFLDFTLAVHLFSSVCVAAAAGAIALAARDFLRLLGLENDLAAIAAGALAAAGFSFWSAALLAKSYALLYLILSLLIWRMIRAHESGKGRDFTIVAALIGLAWAAHPSATNVGLALILFVVAHRSTLSGKAIAGRVGVAAACAIVPSLLLPLFALGHPSTMFADPTSPGTWFQYLLGGAFLSRPGTFGFESWRAVNAVKYLWEDFLGIGLVVALIGLSRIVVVNRKLLLMIGAWILPSAVVATLFKIEGQQDFWLVAAWLPLHVAVAVGFAAIPPRFAKIAIVSLALAGLGWAIAANGRAVSMRGYDLAEKYGRFHLENLEPNSILILDSDDALATVRYLQVVRGIRRDVLVADATKVGTGWYEAHLQRLDPTLKSDLGKSFSKLSRPVYFENEPPQETNLVPAGPLFRLAAADQPNESRSWDFPVRLEDVRARFGRERGIRLEILPDRLIVEPEPYEQRWISLYVRAQIGQGKAAFARNDWKRAAEFLESARAADLEHPRSDVIDRLGYSYFRMNDFVRAEPLLQQTLRMSPNARQAVRILSNLDQICQKQGRTQEALRYRQQALAIIGFDPELKKEFEERQGRPR